MATASPDKQDSRNPARRSRTLWVAASDPPDGLPAEIPPSDLRSSNPGRIHEDLESGEISQVRVDCTHPLIDPVAFVKRLRKKDPDIAIYLLVRQVDRAALTARISAEKISGITWVVVDADLSPG